MADPILVPCLVILRNEFNQLAPNRDKASDGWIGDARHASGQSDHNPDSRGRVHAIDVDKDLRRSGWTMPRAVNLIVDRHRRGQDDRLQNVIYNGKIASRSWGWTWRDYEGANPHDKHAHFSARRNVAAANSTRRFGLLEQEDTTMALTNEDADKVIDRLIGTKLGASGPVVGVALQTSYLNTNKLVAAVAAEVQRDATTAAVLAGMQSAVSALAASTGALGPEAVAALTEQVRLAAAAAGAEAVSALQAKLDSLREHLGDDEQA